MTMTLRKLTKCIFFTTLFSFKVANAVETIPADLVWESNEKDPIYASPDAKRGGVFHENISSFPLTLRYVGPDANSGISEIVRDMLAAAVDFHPITGNVMPQLASQWAFGKDKKSMYFRLNLAAKWSDGVPVSVDDFAYVLDFMRSKNIKDPWYNDYYTTEIDKVVKYDKLTFAVVGKKVKSKRELVNTLSLSPLPKHFLGTLDADYIKKYNWKPIPSTGAYVFDKIEKGKFITLKRVDNWWGDSNRYLKHRFNADTIRLDVVRDVEVSIEKFKKGELDAFSATRPDFWYDKMKGPLFDSGYINKLWFYTQTPQSITGFWLNLDKPIWKEKNLRYAFAHAMDFDGLIKKMLRGDYKRMHAFFSGYEGFSNTEIRAREYSIPKVETLMKSVGWARGSDGIWQKGEERFSVTVTYGVSPHTDRLAYLKEEAKKAGVEINLQLQDSSAAFKAAQEKKVEVYWGGFGIGNSPQPWEFFHSSNAHATQTNNIMNVDNKEMDMLVDAFKDSSEDKDMYRSIWKIEEKLKEIGSFVPSYVVPYFRQAYWRYWRLPKVPAVKMTVGSAFDATSLRYGGLFWFDEFLHRETKDAMKTGKKFSAVVTVDRTYE